MEVTNDTEKIPDDSKHRAYNPLNVMIIFIRFIFIDT